MPRQIPVLRPVPRSLVRLRELRTRGQLLGHQNRAPLLGLRTLERQQGRRSRGLQRELQIQVQPLVHQTLEQRRGHQNLVLRQGLRTQVQPLVPHQIQAPHQELQIQPLELQSLQWSLLGTACLFDLERQTSTKEESIQ